MITLPDRIQVGRIARPVSWVRNECGLRLESVVEAPGTSRGVIFKHWPDKEIPVSGYTWTTWSWLGWTIVFMWSKEEE